jgi:GNAT superfamily N-acetyltransferase
MMPSSDIEFRAMRPEPADLESFASCFERNGMPRRLDTLRWQYLDNPSDELLVELAVADDGIAAIYAVQPATARIRGKSKPAAQSVDTLVDARFRGRGLFTTMADRVYQRVDSRGGAFVYGFPNANSAPGFFRKLGWASLDPVPFLIRPLRTAYLTSKLPLGVAARQFPDLRLPTLGPRPEPGQQLIDLDVLGPELDALWQRFGTGLTVALDRDARYLRWRLSKPGEHYHCIGLFEEGGLVAFCAYTTVDKHGGRIGYVLELLHDPGRHRAGAVLLAECLHRMASDRADVALAWCFRHSPNARAHFRAGFFPLPERLRPIELHFGVRVLDESLTQVLLDRRNWYISYCDSDTV